MQSLATDYLNGVPCQQGEGENGSGGAHSALRHKKESMVIRVPTRPERLIMLSTIGSVNGFGLNLQINCILAIATAGRRPRFSGEVYHPS